ncbi:hypothetical protein D9M68_122740 [compost metagenome]
MSEHRALAPTQRHEAPKEPDWLRTLREEVEMRETERGRRFLLCRHMNGFTAAIESLPIDAQERQEIVNLANVLLRMALIKNDGHVSSQRVHAF